MRSDEEEAIEQIRLIRQLRQRLETSPPLRPVGFVVCIRSVPNVRTHPYKDESSAGSLHVRVDDRHC